MSGSINIDISAVQPTDYIHWTNPRCPSDRYAQVVAVLPAVGFVVIVKGVRRMVPLGQVTGAVRNELKDDKRGPILPLCRGPWGKRILGAT